MAPEPLRAESAAKLLDGKSLQSALQETSPVTSKTKKGYLCLDSPAWDLCSIHMTLVAFHLSAAFRRNVKPVERSARIVVICYIHFRIFVFSYSVQFSLRSLLFARPKFPNLCVATVDLNQLRQHLRILVSTNTAPQNQRRRSAALSKPSINVFSCSVNRT